MYKNTLKEFTCSNGSKYQFYSLPELAKNGFENINKMPFSLRIILESLLRNFDGKKIKAAHINSLSNWQPNSIRNDEVPFVVSRVILQDYTGVPLLADLAAMRDVVSDLGRDVKSIEPLVPVNLVIDHSVQTNFTNMPNALALNMKLEFDRNSERYTFMKWGASAFSKFKITPPGRGIVHQINLENIAKGVFENNRICYPDTVVGTDSHTTMINGIGVVGWGVGGIEAEAAMLGQPIYMLTPDVIGFKLTGKLQEGVTTTDLVLTITQILRTEKVVGKIVEYFGEGTKDLEVPDRATIANMAPDYGATMGYFAVDEKTLQYYKATGRNDVEVDIIANYFKSQELFGIPQNDDINYTKVITLDLSTIVPCVSGPKRPQDRINLPELKSIFTASLTTPIGDGGYGLPVEDINRIPSVNATSVKHGDVVIAGITSCTNTSNPGVLIAAGILAKKAYEYGLTINPKIKSSLAPGSRAVTEYLKNSGLLPFLESVGFSVTAYGCTTCIGNIGDLDQDIEKTILSERVVAASVLSGNRNFEARIHPAVKSNFLMSPPLVVAFALAGTVNINMDIDPIGLNKDNNPVFLKDIWPTNDEIAKYMHFALDPQIYKKVYSKSFEDNALWRQIPDNKTDTVNWDRNSTYIAKPPFFDDFNASNSSNLKIKNARILALLGDSITTDHISPAGSIKADSPAGKFLIQNGVSINDFNSYGARRGHHEVMVRGTFSNTRIKNLMLNREGGYTRIYPDNVEMSIYDAAMKYKENNIDTVIFAGEEYGTGSSRDWAAKGTLLLGVKAVIAKSFERIHRSNLIGMGVLPCQFIDNQDIQSLKLDGSETVSFDDLAQLSVGKVLTINIKKENEETKSIQILARLDTEIEVDYFINGGILPYILRTSILTNTSAI